jgi:hypothetical protein
MGTYPLAQRATFCFNSTVLRPAALLFSLLFALGSRTLTPEETRWNQPVPPFRIAGNIYYVGAYEVTSYAIRTEKGLILLDSGFAETVPLIERNLHTLGLDPRTSKSSSTARLTSITPAGSRS